MSHWDWPKVQEDQEVPTVALSVPLHNLWIIVIAFIITLCFNKEIIQLSGQSFVYCETNVDTVLQISVV